MGLVRIPLAAIRPQISNTAMTAMSHAQNARDVYERERPIMFGPQGVLDAVASEETSDYDGHIRWPFVDGDNTSDVVLADTFVLPYTTDPLIEVRADFIATHLVLDWGIGVTPSYEELRALRASATWDITFDVLQFDDGDADWSAATSLATHAHSARTMRHWPTIQNGVYPFLQQMCWAKHGHATRDYTFTYKEGMMHTVDFALVDTVKFMLDVSGWTSGAVRLRLKATRDTGVTPTYEVGVQESTEHLRLSLIAISANEVPQ